jgi:phosphoribosylglycinamide formyltransferase-1
MKKCSVAVFASGNGSNAENLFHYFSENESIEVTLLVCNKSDAPVILKAKNFNIPVVLLSNEQIEQGDELLAELQKHAVEWIVLAGFLRKVPDLVIQRFSNRIINIHPSLLPKFGGKGMYGMHVHRAVSEAGDNVSGVTIHLVNEEFDKGRILAQFKVDLQAHEAPESIASKIHSLEHEHFPIIVEQTILNS